MPENDQQQTQSNPIYDLFRSAIEHNHVAASDAFDRAISQKIAAGLDDYEQQMAASLFSSDESEEEAEDQEQVENQEEEESDEQTDQ